MVMGRRRCGKGSEPEPLPSPPFSPWTSPAPPSPCAKEPSGVQGLERPGLERRDGEGSGKELAERMQPVAEGSAGKMETGPG